MSDQHPNEPIVPEGLDFLRLVLEQEDQCEEHTRQRLIEMGEKAPQCLEHLGSVLSLLDRAASCFWECRGGDHIVEYLAGRVSSSARAALRLLYFGFYDESLLLTRGIGEVANLLFLFMKDSQVLGEWQRSSKKERLNGFTPVKIRLRLEALGIPVPIDEHRYTRLCEIAAHVTPQTKPQAHNPFGMPFNGAYFQEAGVLVSLNELAAATALVTVPLPQLLNLDEEKRKYFREAALKLLQFVGAVNVLSVQDIWEQIQNQSDGGNNSNHS